MQRERINKPYRNIQIFDKSQTHERLKLQGFGCNVAGCDWELKADSISDYSGALREHGRHNLEKHIHNPSARITWVYKQS